MTVNLKKDMMSSRIFVVLLMGIVSVPVATSSTGKSEAFSFECGEKGFTGIVNKASFPTITKIELNNPSCGEDGNRKTDNGTHLIITSTFGECSTTEAVSNSTITHENTVHVFATKGYVGVVERASKYDYTMKCVLPRSMSVSTGNYFNATGKFIYSGKFSASQNNTLEVTIDFYQSDSFAIKADNPVSVTTNQPIYLRIEEVNSNPYFRLVVNKCFATPGLSADGSRYSLVEDKCPMDPTLQILENKDHHINFKVDAFAFIALKKAIHIHCYLFVCPADATSAACTQDCNLGRKRRSVADQSTPDQIRVTTQQLSYSRKTTCKETSCPENSFCVDLYPAQCRCKEGYVFHWKEGTCTRSRLFYVRGVHFDDQFYDSYSDTTSVDFLRYASRIEKLFMEELKKEDKGIDGARVKFLKRGSVVVDLLLTYSDKITEREAFDNFVATFMDETSVRNTLNIKRHIKPSFDTYEEEIEEEKSLLYKVLIPVVVVVPIVCGILMGIAIWQRRVRHLVLMKQNPTGITNIAVELEVPSANSVKQ